ncbi:extensin-2-like [Homalodisca vitripennis]|uniref:extensin-2-like n=1 Tax=Homalodisca vitripennis TaxID=197043 RepID=UPI001EEA976B|nr:extensin-2-like [Homalodisca vitripennis]
MLLLQVVSILLATRLGGGTEVAVPERYLRPRDYNPHPLETLLAATLPQQLLDQQPYPYLSREDRRQDNRPVQFPDVPDSVKPTKSHTPGYITVPKNYAFAYAVKDRQSGDDFSHKQAHNGQSTKGEYRVRLPDGRTQIVSYTADKHGYKADVRYDERPLAKRPEASVYYSPPTYTGLSNSILQDPDYPEDSELVYKQPLQVVHKSSLAQQYTRVTATPRPLEVLFSPTPQPYKSLGQPVQFRSLPQTAAEYTRSDGGSYYPNGPSPPAPGYYAPAVSSTAATPIVEEQDDIPAPTKPLALSQYYGSTPSPPSPPPTAQPAPAVRYILVPQSTDYVYTDS